MTTAETWLKRNWVAIVAFIIQLVVLGVYMGRQEQITANLERRATTTETEVRRHHDDLNLHSSAEWRTNTTQMLVRVEAKLDAYIAANKK